MPREEGMEMEVGDAVDENGVMLKSDKLEEDGVRSCCLRSWGERWLGR